MGIFGPPNIEKLEAKKNIKGLVKLLHYGSSSEIRRKAAIALDQLGWKPPNDVEKSYYLLGKQNWTELQKVSEPAVNLLIRELKGGNTYSSREAATLLGEIGDTRAIKPLVDALYRAIDLELTYSAVKDFEISREAVIQALKKIGKPALDSVHQSVQSVITKGFAARGISDVIPHPVMILVGPSADTIQNDCVKSIAKMGDLVIDPLIQALKYKNSSVRKNAASTLGEIGDSQAVGPLNEALEDEDEYVREAAEGALEKIKEKKS